MSVLNFAHGLFTTLVALQQAVPFALQAATAIVAGVLLVSCDVLRVVTPDSSVTRWVRRASVPMLGVFGLIVVMRFAAIFNLG